MVQKVKENIVSINYGTGEMEMYSYGGASPVIPNIGDFISRDGEYDDKIKYEVKNVNHRYKTNDHNSISHIITISCKLNSPKAFDVR